MKARLLKVVVAVYHLVTQVYVFFGLIYLLGRKRYYYYNPDPVFLDGFLRAITIPAILVLSFSFGMGWIEYFPWWQGSLTWIPLSAGWFTLFALFLFFFPPLFTLLFLELVILYAKLTGRPHFVEHDEPHRM